MGRPVTSAHARPVRSSAPEPGSHTEDAAWEDSADASGVGATKRYAPGSTDTGFLIPERYALLGTLGAGSLGRVFSARDRTLDRGVALKFLDHRHAGDSRKLASFIREASITARLEHSAILPVHELACTEQGELYFAMRQAPGMSLAEAITQDQLGKPPAAIAGIDGKLQVILRACDAVAYAHSQGIYHRDLKPENIIFGEFGEVAVLDWGAASTPDTRAYETSRLIGTPAYMAPEQARMEPADARSDLYCLAATLFHLLLHRHVAWDGDREVFWTKRRSGVIDPLTAAEQQRVPGPLLAVLRKALAAEPADRHQTVAELQLDLRAYQSHAESLRLVEIARTTLLDAQQRADYAGFTRAAVACEHARELWNGNTLAAELLSQIRAGHARTALAKGDIALAASQLDAADPDHRELLRQVAEADVQRIAAKLRLRRMRFTAAGLVLVALGLVGFSAWQWSLRFGAWQTAWERDFLKPGATTEGIRGFHFNPQEAITLKGVDDEGLILTPQIYQVIEDLEVPGDVRIEFELKWDRIVDGLDVCINSSNPRTMPQWWGVPVGYSCQFGGFQGIDTFISVNTDGGAPTSGNNLAEAFDAQRWYRLAFQRRDRELSLDVDGQTILRYQSVLPLAGRDLHWVSFRCWSGAHVRRLTVQRRSLPEHASPLVAGDALFADGHTESAIRTWHQIASDLTSETAAEGLAKAYLASLRLGAAFPDTQRQALRERLTTEFPEAGVLTTVLQSDAVAAWRDQRFDAALTLAERIQTKDPATRIGIELLQAGRSPLSQENGQRLLRLLSRTPNVLRLDLQGLGLTSLEPLRRMRLRYLNVGNNRISDLGPLQDMHLSVLEASCNLIHDLSPLSGKRYIRLAFSTNRISDLTPLSSITLEEGLWLIDNPVTTIEPLRGVKLRELQIGQTQVRDLSPLTGSRIESLSLDGAPVEDLEPLRHEPLRLIFIQRSKVTRIDAVANPLLERIGLDHTMVDSLAPLSSCPKLDWLSISGCPITDLTPIAKANLRYLEASDTPLADLAPLQGHHLNHVWIRNTRVGDLSPIANEHLNQVDATGAPIASAGALLLKPPRWFYLDTSSPILDQAMSQLAKSPDQAGILRGLEMIRAAQAGDRETARRLATGHGGHRYLWVPLAMDFSRAEQLARQLGGHLVTITDQAEHELVVGLDPGNQVGGWLGCAMADDGSFHWLTGEPMTFTKWSWTNWRTPMASRAYLSLGLASNEWLTAIPTHKRYHPIIEWDE